MKETYFQPGGDFRERVWAFVRSVPEGRVVTYGQIAYLLGMPRGARAVGTVLKNTPGSANVPCQRVVNRWGRLAPVYGSGGMQIRRGWAPVPAPTDLLERRRKGYVQNRIATFGKELCVAQIGGR